MEVYKIAAVTFQTTFPDSFYTPISKYARNKSLKHMQCFIKKYFKIPSTKKKGTQSSLLCLCDMKISQDTHFFVPLDILRFPKITQ